jgi:hypothetical protein
LKITLTREQVEELKRGALAEQNKAEQAFKDARNRYNRVSSLRTGYAIDIMELATLSTGVPDTVAPVQPVSTTVNRKNYTAYSRTGRREANGGLAMPNVSVAYLNYAGGPVEVTCTCPAFTKGAGVCWASTEAKAQFLSPTRKSGTNNVYYKGV